MNYQECVAYLDEYGKLGSVYGLERMHALLDALGNPHLPLKVIHLAGTNGKGSVSNLLSRILTASGFRAGLFNSPYILSYCETLQLNHESIRPDDFARVMTRIRSACEALDLDGIGHPTTFEMMTAAAYFYFHDVGADFVVMEAGLGGAIDSTNVHPCPVLTMITSVSYDHMALLGTTLAEIAGAKAGILKPAVPVILGPLPEEALKVVLDTALSCQAPIIRTGIGYDQVQVLEQDLKGTLLDVQTEAARYTRLRLNLPGVHQQGNLLMALHGAEVLKAMGFNRITSDSIHRGIQEARWSCRCEYLDDGDVPLLIDGAHNVESLSAYAALLADFVPHPVTLLFGVLGDKPFDAMIPMLAPFADTLFVTEPLNPRALDVMQLAEVCRPYFAQVHPIRDAYQAFDRAFAHAKRTGTTLCCVGSLSLAVPLRNYYSNNFSKS